MSKDEPRVDDAAALKRRVGELRKELRGLGPLMRGSLVVIGTRNKQPYFSVNIKRRTHLLYLGRRREKKAKAYSQNCRRLQEIVEDTWPPGRAWRLSRSSSMPKPFNAGLPRPRPSWCWRMGRSGSGYAPPQRPLASTLSPRPAEGMNACELSVTPPTH